MFYFLLNIFLFFWLMLLLLLLFLLFLLFFHLPIIYLSLAISFFKFYISTSYSLPKPSNYIITVIIIIIIIIIIITTIIITIIIIVALLINITVIGILDKSSRGKFRARNSSGMVNPYSS